LFGIDVNLRKPGRFFLWAMLYCMLISCINMVLGLRKRDATYLSATKSDKMSGQRRTMLQRRIPVWQRQWLLDWFGWTKLQ